MLYDLKYCDTVCTVRLYYTSVALWQDKADKGRPWSCVRVAAPWTDYDGSL